MLVEVSTPRTVGRVSGLGWGLGYIGGILALVLVVVLDQAEWFGLDTSDGLAYRLIAVGCAVWTVVFAIPFVLNVPEAPRARRPREDRLLRAATDASCRDIVGALPRATARRSGS